MKKFLDKYNYLEERFLVFSLGVTVLLVFFQIIMRTLFNASLSWSEELSRYIFIWQIWLGTSVAFSKREHIKVDLIFSIFKSKRSHKIINFIVSLIWLSFNVFLVYQGIKLLNSMNARNALSSGMRIPLIYIYAALPISSFMLSIKILYSMFEEFKGEDNVKDKIELEG